MIEVGGIFIIGGSLLLPLLREGAGAVGGRVSWDWEACRYLGNYNRWGIYSPLLRSPERGAQFF